jgi:hypothetical protein
MQCELTVLERHAQVTETLEGLSIRLRYQSRPPTISVAVLGLLCWVLFGAFVWQDGWSSAAGVLAALLALCTAGGILVSRHQYSVPLHLTAHAITLGQDSVTWDEVVDVTVVTETNTTFLELITLTGYIRHAFWTPPEVHAPLMQVIRAHLAQHRPAIKAEDALPESLRELRRGELAGR